MYRDQVIKTLDNLASGVAYFGTVDAYREWERNASEALSIFERDLQIAREIIDVKDGWKYTIENSIRTLQNALSTSEISSDRYGRVRGAIRDSISLLKEVDVRSPMRAAEKIDNAIEELRTFVDNYTIPGGIRNDLERVIMDLDDLSDKLKANAEYMEIADRLGDINEAERLYGLALENFEKIKREIEYEMEILDRVKSISWEPHFTLIKRIKEMS